MKNSNQLSIRTISKYLFILSVFLVFACDEKPAKDTKKETSEVEDVNKFKDIVWNVVAIQKDGKSMGIKAIDPNGNTFDVKAIQNSDQDSFLDVKAGDENLAIKVLVSKSQFAPVKAIVKNKVAHDIVAINESGEKLEVQGIVRSGNIVVLKAIDKDGNLYAIKAISPDGTMNDVKGIKINTKEKEMTSKGFDVYAHVKAMHPSDNEDDFKPNEKPKKKTKKNAKKEVEFKEIIWNVKAVTLDGKNLDIKAFDAEGNKYDVKAVQDSEQHSFMNIRAFVDKNELPIKILVSEDEFAPVKAIGRDGTIYDVKALTADGTKLDVKGISRSGNIIHVKAINTNGDQYGVKAFSPDGKLNDVKGIKIFVREKELSIRGNDVYAHLKAIQQ